MRVYMAGPMHRAALYNFLGLRRASNRGRAMGNLRSIARPTRPQLGFDECRRALASRSQVMIIRDVVEASKCDAIALLPGWEGSSGQAGRGVGAGANFLDLLVLDARTFQVMEEWYEQGAKSERNGAR